MNNRRDWQIVRQDGWYRIPVKSAPREVGRTRYLAFYQTKAFGPERWAVNYYAPVLDCRVVPRRELLPDESAHPRAEEPYFQLRLGDLRPLPRPIASRRLRRIVFIPTSWDKLLRAEEINDLFDESPLEDVVWAAFKRDRIEAERQFYVNEPRVTYCLDFAIFCRTGQIDVECDGDSWHAQKDAIPRDNERNNILTSKGWSVLRFGSQEINSRLSGCMELVRDTVNELGGLVTVEGALRRFEGGEGARQLRLW